MSENFIRKLYEECLKLYEDKIHNWLGNTTKFYNKEDFSRIHDEAKAESIRKVNLKSILLGLTNFYFILHIFVYFGNL